MNFSAPTIIETIDKEMPLDKQRFNVLWLITWVIALIFVGRSFYLQVMHGSDYLSEAERNRVAVLIEPAPRGIIYDRTGEQAN